MSLRVVLLLWVQQACIEQEPPALTMHKTPEGLHVHKAPKGLCVSFAALLLRRL